MRRGNADQAGAALDGLMRVVERLTYVSRKVAVIAAPRLTALLRRQFDEGTDPYGRPWRPLMALTLARGRRPPPLTDTGALRYGTTATAASGNRASLRILVNSPYGKFHQYGFRVGRTKVGPRRILPNNGMPREWSAVLKQASREAMKQATSGGAQ